VTVPSTSPRAQPVIEIAPGVSFSAWTFGDQVPGPTVRARVGDRVRFSMTNRSDEVGGAGARRERARRPPFGRHGTIVVETP
jgi:FtsP/CotA-like multicopper oxidase with cupredoxin domain